MKIFLIIICLFYISDCRGDSQSGTRSNYKLITIGTGEVTGIYYPVGGAICRLTNQNIANLGIRCSVNYTNGSMDNLKSLLDKKNDFAILQSDVFHDAYNESDKSLRAVFSLYPESLTLIVRTGDSIKQVEDLKGKRIASDVEGYGNKNLITRLFADYNFNKQDLANVTEMDLLSQPEALCSNKIDAMVVIVGHPSAVVKDVSSSCDVTILPIADDKISDLVNKNPYYVASTIKGGTYQGNPNDIKTFGVSAILVSTKDVDADIVYKLTKSVLDSFSDFRALIPAISFVDKTYMVNNLKPESTHEGAKKYFKEANLLFTQSESITQAEKRAAEEQALHFSR